MNVGKLAAFAAGLLLGACITVYGLRSFLFRRDSLMRQIWPPPPAPPPPSPAPAAAPPPLAPPPLAPPPPPPEVTQQLQTTTAGGFPASQDPSGLRSCTERSCLGADVSGIHRSVILLATGPERFPVFHSPGFFPLYVVTSDNEAKLLFDGGANSVWFGLDRFQDLPFTDFAADMVVLDVSSFSKPALGGVITEAVRILTQQGVLFVLGASDFNLSDFSPQAAKLVLAGSHAHSFVRRRGIVPDLPICQTCGMTPLFDKRSIELSNENQCQAWVKPGFKSIFDPSIAGKFNHKSKESFERQRLKHWNRKNVFQILPNKTSWADGYSRATPASWETGYVSSDPSQLTPDLEKQIRAGKRKRILDAGAGSCSLEGELRRKGYLKSIQHFLAFGAYDCSMLRICAERGSISFQHNWLVPLPVCSTCKFDLIYQHGGVHHMSSKDDHQKFLDNILGLLECKGLLYVQDGGTWYDLWAPILQVKLEQKTVTYKWNGKNEVTVHRTC